MEIEIEVHGSLATCSRDEWQGLAGDNPFVSYDFLDLLQRSGCASPATGWHPRYLLARQDGRLVGATFAYLKTHSRGEFVFDQGWAQAFQQHGIAYYPKLLVAVPFSPVTGNRLLGESEEIRDVLARALLTLARDLEVSSVHVLFPDADDEKVLIGAGYMVREQIQFHWTNENYPDFTAFLSAMSHDKRKKIKQDRRRVNDAGVSFKWLSGHSIGEAELEFFYACYQKTYEEHWSAPYLTLAFFKELHLLRPDMLVLVVAEREGQGLACALNVQGGGVLYGRYWGAVDFVSGLHFETCYMQAIDYCIQNGLKKFEGGAQGEHKMARGLLPARTTSAHWVADPRFADAIADFLNREVKAVGEYMEGLERSSPFRHDTPQSTGAKQ